MIIIQLLLFTAFVPSGTLEAPCIKHEVEDAANLKVMVDPIFLVLQLIVRD